MSQIQHKPLSNEEYKRIKGKHPVTDLFLATGARISEINRIITQWQGDADYIDIKTKKSGSHLNRIWLTESAIKYIVQCKELGIDGKSNKTIERIVNKVFEENGIKGKSSHCLRSSFATTLMSRGVDIKTIQVLLNHKSVEQTAEYIYFDEHKMRSALRVMEKLETFRGLTLPELQSRIIEQDAHIIRLEEELLILQKENEKLKKGVSNE